MHNSCEVVHYVVVLWMVWYT